MIPRPLSLWRLLTFSSSGKVFNMTTTSTVRTIGEVTHALDSLAPPALAQSWDNVGLLAGDREAPCRRVLFCIDLTPAVLEEAIEQQSDLVVTYHPPIFRPIPRLIAQSLETDGLVFRAIQAGIALYSPHTALDAAPGGTNDVIANLCELTDVEPFEYVSVSRRQYKLTTFVPENRVDALAAALFDAGAGHIGDYEQCSFRLRGEGTFFGTQTTNPQIGERGRLERVAEVRLEMVAPERRLPEIVAALRKHHGYEEPAFDIYPLEGEPQAGIGRVGALPEGATLGALAARLKASTASRVATLVGPPGQSVRRAAVCVGAAGRLPFEKWRSAEADVIVTGEIRHHDALSILRRGRCAIALGHWESERPVLDSLAERLQQAISGVAIALSDRDAGPFTPVG
jgi:dinuclear metal center YbgI/SA1388 family protein